LDNGKRPTPTNTTKIKGCCKHQSSPHTEENFEFCRKIAYDILDAGKKETKTTRKW
jgi:hypothetical protein